MYDSRGDETSAAVACAAAAATAAAAAAAAAARGRSCINHRAEASTEPNCCWGNPLRWDYWKCNCASRNNSVNIVIINQSIDQTGNTVHGICMGI